MDHYRTPEQPDPADPNWRHPVEEMEPVDVDDAYRSASKKLLFILNRAAIFVIHAENPQIAMWQVCYALGLPVCAGVSMTDRAREIGVGRAAISKGTTYFQRATGIPVSEYMKSEDAAVSYAGARIKQLQ